MASQDRDEDTLPEYLLELRREGAGEDEVLDPAPEGTDAATAAAAPPVNTLLGLPALGLYAISNPLRQFAIAKTIEALKSIGAEWHGRHPNAPIGIGDISKHGGGPFPPHAGHKRGVDVDIRPQRKDEKEEPITVGSSQYSHRRNKELIEQMIRGNGVLQVARIFFNDDDIDGAEPLSGHSNHIHVQFKLP